MGKSHQRGWVSLRGKKWYGYFRRVVYDPINEKEKTKKITIILGSKSDMSKREARDMLRREMTKVARHKGEEAKVAVRNVRRKAKEELDRIVKDGEAGEDDVRRAEKELDDLTAQHVNHIDEAVKNKETELLEV